MDLLLDNKITKEAYNLKFTQIDNRQNQINTLLNNHYNGNKQFKTALISLLTLCSKSQYIFKSSKNDEKRLLLKYLFSNIKLHSKTLHLSMARPVFMMIDNDDLKEWLGYLESNQGSRNQKPLPYRLAIPQQLKYYLY